MFQRFLFWPLFAGLMGFALGGTIIAALHDQVSKGGQHHFSRDGNPEQPWWRLVTDPNIFIAIFTGCLVVTSFVQNRALLRANRVAIIAARVARRATKIAEINGREMRQIGQAQVRAYLAAVESTLIIDQTNIQFWLKISNGGLSPAMEIMTSGSLVGAIPSRAPRFPGDSENFRTAAVRNKCELIAAGQIGEVPLGFDAKIIGNVVLNVLAEGEGVVRPIVDIEWIDVFGRRQSISASFWQVGTVEISQSSRTYRMRAFNVNYSQHDYRST